MKMESSWCIVTKESVGMFDRTRRLRQDLTGTTRSVLGGSLASHQARMRFDIRDHESFVVC